MKTVQRSPRRMGAGEDRARRENSPTIETPSRSACSSRNDPVPAAHASFIVKSTTTPSSTRMNLESCPPISKIVSTASPVRVRATCTAPVLWAVISSWMASAPTSYAIRSPPPDPGVGVGDDEPLSQREGLAQRLDHGPVRRETPDEGRRGNDRLPLRDGRLEVPGGGVGQTAQDLGRGRAA